VEQSPPPSDREMFQHMPFPFPDGRFPDSLGAVVQRTVLSGDFPAREVVHTPDGSWLIGDGVTNIGAPADAERGRSPVAAALGRGVRALLRRWAER